MVFSDEQLSNIYDRTNGRCHLCRKKLCFSNYGRWGQKAAWEVDHSLSRASGGSDHFHNLFPACMSCNRSKQAASSRSHRQRNGYTRVPLSKAKLQSARESNVATGAIIGGLVGLLGGPGGALIGAGLGAWLGDTVDPE
jgi:hypothetical protein